MYLPWDQYRRLGEYDHTYRGSWVSHEAGTLSWSRLPYGRPTPPPPTAPSPVPVAHGLLVCPRRQSCCRLSAPRAWEVWLRRCWRARGPVYLIFLFRGTTRLWERRGGCTTRQRCRWFHYRLGLSWPQHLVMAFPCIYPLTSGYENIS